LLVFLVSGASGLIYEVIWTRVLLTVFGATIYAVSTVLAAFMGGLALGSLFGGRLADRVRRPLFCYGVLELAIAGTAVAVPGMLGLFDPLYRAVYASGSASFLALSLLRFVFCFAVLLIPTTCMGATLPLLSRFLVRRGDGLGGRIGALYTVNTTGAVVGTFLAGFVLIERFGVHHTILLAAAGSAGVGALALLLSWKWERALPTGWQASLETGEAATVDKVAPGVESEVLDRENLEAMPRWMPGLVLCAYGVSGFLALAYQVLWSRALVFRFEFLKNTTYSFSAMLTVFLVGLAVGSAVMSARIDRQRSPVRLFGLLQVLTGLAGAFSLIMLMWGVNLIPLPDPLDRETNTVAWGLSVLNVFAKTVAVIGFPTFLMGMAFPVAARICVQRLRAVGSGIGRLYAFNTVGAILGSFTAGFLLIPLMGLAHGFLALGFVYILMGSVVLVTNPLDSGRHRFFWLVLPVLALGVFFLRVSDGKHYVFQDVPTDVTGKPLHQMLGYEEGPLATVAVVENSIGSRTLYVDNVGVAGTDRILLTDQKSLAHIPMLFLNQPKSALTVGFGSGGASWSFLQYRELDRVDCLEICETVPRMAPLLKESNHGVLDEWDGGPLAGRKFHNGRYQMILDDARSYLRFSNARYDIIATDCTDLRYKSNANLYDREYFELCRQAITDDGMVVVWMPLGGMSPEVFACALRTFAEVFPGEQTTLWYMNNEPTHYMLLLGTKQPLKINLARMQERLGRAEIRTDVEGLFLHTPEKILSCYLGSMTDCADFLKGQSPVLNTEDRPFLEFESPKFGFGDEPLLTNLDLLPRRPAAVLERVEDKAAFPEVARRIERYASAVDDILAGHAALRRLRVKEACAAYLKAQEKNPDDPCVPFLLTFDDLLRISRKPIEADPLKSVWARLMLADAQLVKQEYDAAAAGYNEVMNQAGPLLNGSSVASDLFDRAILGIARCYQGLGNSRKGLQHLDQYKSRVESHEEYAAIRQGLEELNRGK
jgi:spermidine synthase